MVVTGIAECHCGSGGVALPLIGTTGAGGRGEGARDSYSLYLEAALNQKSDHEALNPVQLSDSQTTS